jgi:hypothetical protein
MRLRGAIVAVAVCVPSLTRAEPAGVSRPLEYSAPSECPDASAFSAQIAQRTALWAQAQPDLRVRVHVESNDGGVHGVLTLEVEGRSTRREVRGERCGDVAQALALIVAILVDPDADTRPLPELPATTAPPLAATSSRPPPAPGGPPATWIPGAGMELAVTAGMADAAMLGQRWFLTLSREAADAPSVTLRLAAGRDGTGTMEHGGGASSALSRTSLRFDGCGAALTERPFTLSVCGFVEAGRLHAFGVHPVRSESENRGWFAVGAAVRAALRYRRVLSLEVGLDAGIPLTRYRFEFEGDALYETAPVVPGGGLALSVHFP